MSWQRIKRRTVYETSYMSMWEDTIRLPNGQEIDDYSLVRLPDGVLVVATDEHDRMLLFEEYKYAVDSTILTFPAGGIDGNETPIEAAARELLEETGYNSDYLEILGSFYPYPSKISHKTYIVRAKNAVKTDKVHLSELENIGEVQLVPTDEIPELLRGAKLNTTYMVTAFALAFPDKLS